MRSGTLAPHLVVGLGEAAKVCLEEMKNDHEHIQRLNNRFLTKLRSELSHIVVNGDET